MLNGCLVTFGFEPIHPDIGMRFGFGEKLSMVFCFLFEEDEIGVFMVGGLKTIVVCWL